MIRVLFLCLGNICRSPMAEAVFRDMVEKRGLSEEIDVDSAGLGRWHMGERPHRGTLEVLQDHGIAHDWMQSRQIETRDLHVFDYIVAMDEENMEGLAHMGASESDRVFLLLNGFEEGIPRNVPDPYYTGNFETVYDLVKKGCERLLAKLIADHQLQ